MKLLIIVLCILSERYLIHAASAYRFHWFNAYINLCNQRLLTMRHMSNSYVAFASVILPIMLAVLIVLVLLGNILYGIVGFLLNLIVFYYCLGAENLFYPVSKSGEDWGQEKSLGRYLANVNNQLFAVIFWFIFIGPLGVVLYRLCYLCRQYALTQVVADAMIGVLDWIPVRLTGLLYLLVGNFQQGFGYYSKMFFSSPENNDVMLETVGLLAARRYEADIVDLPVAEKLVEHALIVYLVLFSLLTLLAEF